MHVARKKSQPSIPSARRRQRDRRGLATGWLLIWSPIFLAAIVLAVEVGNVLLAKVQLENALESAALAAVKQWKDSNSTASARDFAVAYGRANTVSGQEVVLDRNDGGPGPNGNLSCDGDILLGAADVEDDECNIILDADSSPAGGGSGVFVSICVRVETVGDTKNDAQTGDYSFSIFDFSSNTPGLELASAELNVSTVPPADSEPGYFDFRTPPGMGVSNDQQHGVTPIFLGTDVNNFSTSPLISDDTTSPTYAINFLGAGADAFQSGTPVGAPSVDRFEFSVDTDFVGPDPGNNPQQFVDIGGELAGTTATLTFQLGGNVVGTVAGEMVFISDHVAEICFDNVEVSTGGFGVRTMHRMSVAPICADLFGLPFNGFEVCGEAAAVCVGNELPRLVRIRQIICTD